MDIQLLSFVLAMLVGGLCFGLVKHTADEFDHWYDDTIPAKLRIPAMLTVVATFGGIALFVFTR